MTFTSPSEDVEDRLSSLLRETVAIDQDLEGNTLLFQRDGTVLSVLLDDSYFFISQFRWFPC